ncbi:MAG: DNA polymerase III subunit delta [Bacteroidota bacterium]|nr:DNA polymerase III subunit delta [Bacteroidota bacterium]
MASQSFEQIIKSLQQRKYESVYFLHGTESYFIDAISDFIETNVLSDAEKGFNQAVYYGKDISDMDLYNACTRYPMMSERQVIIVKEAQNFKGFDKLEKYFSHPVTSTLLVIAHKQKSLDKRLKTYKVIEKNAVMFESKALPEAKLNDFVKMQAEINKVVIQAEATNSLIEFVGDQLDTLANAVTRLSSGLLEGNNVINKQMIIDNISKTRDYTLFDLNRALSSRNHNQIANLSNYFSINHKEFPMPYIVGTMYSFFSKALALHLSKSTSDDTFKQLGINPWGKNEYLNAIKNYGHKLINIMQLIQEYDLRFKGVNDAGTEDSELTRELIYRIQYL